MLKKACAFNYILNRICPLVPVIFFSKPNTFQSAVGDIVGVCSSPHLQGKLPVSWCCWIVFPRRRRHIKIYYILWWYFCLGIFFSATASTDIFRQHSISTVSYIVPSLFWNSSRPGFMCTYIYLPIQISLTKRHVVIEFWNEGIMQEFVFCIFPGSETRYRHQLKGYLAGLSYLPNGNENPEVLKCLHQCSESLQIPSLQDSSTRLLSPGMQVLYTAVVNLSTTYYVPHLLFKTHIFLVLSTSVTDTLKRPQHIS